MAIEIMQTPECCEGKCDIPRQNSHSAEASVEVVRDALKAFFAGAERVAVMGIGSRLRGDDAAGLLTAALLRRALARQQVGVKTLVVSGDTAPENVTGEIKKFRPTHLLILDAADTGR